jgi:hypothetical protein
MQRLRAWSLWEQIVAGIAAGIVLLIVTTAATFAFHSIVGRNQPPNITEPSPQRSASPSPGVVRNVEFDLAGAPPKIPQVSWIVVLGEPTDNVADFAVECRSELDRQDACRPGEETEYHILPTSNRGVKVADVDVNPTDDRSVCDGAIGRNSRWIKIESGGFYCIYTKTYIMGIRFGELPPAGLSISVPAVINTWKL